MVFLIDSLVDLANAISQYISMALEVLINAFFHPFIYFTIGIGNIVKLIFNAFIGLFGNLWNTFEISYNFISNTLTGFFPNIWTTIILTGFTIVFLLRIYYFLKDISILGNKI